MQAEATVIPGRLNTVLVLAVCALQLGLLICASHLHGWWLLAPGVPFALLFLTNYALMHEASHGSLHADPRRNRLLGSVTGLTFPTSATMMRVTHAVHHRCNRTDHEMFDCYYPGDRVWLKRAQWYSILTGLFYVIIPPGAFAVGFLRPLLLSGPFKRARSAAVLFDDFTAAERRLVRRECAALVALYVLLFASGALSPGPVLLLFALGGCHWSTRQYVTHAWSRREVMTGAHNLTPGAPLMRWILLNGHWDQAHHRWPMVPWIHLPGLAAECAAPIPFWPQYLSQWTGPRPAAGPGPAALPNVEWRREGVAT
ncbi:MAG: fatty acid desaturase [Planctomycetes bacterium]|nr:fatty acid desaturase [Planctomycetota bacterium]